MLEASTHHTEDCCQKRCGSFRNIIWQLNLFCACISITCVCGNHKCMHSSMGGIILKLLNVPLLTSLSCLLQCIFDCILTCAPLLEELQRVTQFGFTNCTQPKYRTHSCYCISFERLISVRTYSDIIMILSKKQGIYITNHNTAKDINSLESRKNTHSR